MPVFIIETVNQAFAARDEGQIYADVAAGRRAAIAAASEIAYQEILTGVPTVTVESTVEDQSGNVLAKLVVSMSVGDLKT